MVLCISPCVGILSNKKVLLRERIGIFFIPGKEKWNPIAMKCIFVGYSRTQKGYRCYCPALRRFFVTADVTFFESTPYFCKGEGSSDLFESFIPVPVSVPVSGPPVWQGYTRRPRDNVDPPLQVTSPPVEVPPPVSSEADDPSSGILPSDDLYLPLYLKRGLLLHGHRLSCA